MATPVGLTYKEQKYFNTLCGGCLTLFLGILLATVFVTQLLRMTYNPVFTASETSQHFDVENLPEIKLNAYENTMTGRLTENSFKEGIGDDFSWVDQAARI